MSRLPLPDPEKLTPEQRRAYDAIASGPRGGVRGPFAALLYVPELADRIQSLGEYLRFKSCFPTRLTELVVLLAARHQTCQYAWQAHEPQAQKAGLSQAIIDAVRERRRPTSMQPDETAVFDYTYELLSTGKVTDASYAAAEKLFDRRGTIELGALIGYYTMIGMTLIAHEVPLKSGMAPPLSN
jgi:4-carboxymuconolactone decarboxylase